MSNSLCSLNFAWRGSSGLTYTLTADYLATKDDVAEFERWVAEHGTLRLALRALVRVVRTQLDAEHYVAGVAERVIDGTATEEEVKELERMGGK